ncbi:unnamed protein product (macronuclear) [Paramecium tetraurelia]|uniref:VWFA domain-containing protein n=1 Tax=Paramecium tetraurelia TaxID=5888 RepID=A0CDA1_PARTE|nr:uncharacterized protein GSPATT00006979001 [Paramecium tetraurelia]CAK68768.1 unnamed protein product [Paramecium tetraurelia]|eukprot:XP_001436165.1 hypothetical protein (macronuclear) [Paramecium tetraurelia strain d4-2]
MIQQEVLNEIFVPNQLAQVLETVAQSNKNGNLELDYFGVKVREGKYENIATLNKKKQQKIKQQQQQQSQQQAQTQQQTADYVEQDDIDDKYAKQIQFDDDENLDMDQIQQQQQFQDTQAYNINENIEFYLTSEYKTLRFNDRKALSCLVGIKAKEVHQPQVPQQIEGDAQNQFNMDQQQHSKVGVDLLCVIDRSGSMSGEKIEMVKQTLNILLNFLGPKDRLCLIQFDDTCQRLTNLRRVTDENKTYYSDIISKIYANGGTVIGLGTQMALKQIKYRKSVNNVTAIFVLSDGQDEAAISSLQKQLAYYKQTLTIHSFGFGSDHDAKLMTKISNLGKGSFYFVNNISLLDEFFVDALGALTSMVVTDISINLENIMQNPYDAISLSKFYGQEKLNYQNKTIHLKIPYLAEGQRRDFVFQLNIPYINNNVQSENVVMFKASARITSSQTRETIEKQAELVIRFVDESQLINEEQDYFVTEQVFRVESAEVIKDALHKCQNRQNQQAINLIGNLISKVQENPQLTEKVKNIVADLEQVKQAARQEYFNKFGSKQMYQIISNNYNQQGINAKFDATGIQLQQEEQSQFQNQKQMMWVKKVQYQKKCKP